MIVNWKEIEEKGFIDEEIDPMLEANKHLLDVDSMDSVDV